MTQDMIYTFRGHLKWMCILLLGGMLYKCQLGATDECWHLLPLYPCGPSF